MPRKANLKRIIAIILTCSLLIGLTGCKKDKQANKLFKYDLSAEPLNLDPQLATDYASLLVIENLFEGLLRVNPDGKLTEGVATDYKVSNDGKRYTFTLRQNAKWHDERDLNADDFIFAFRRLMNPVTQSPSAKNFYCIKNAQKCLEEKLDLKNLGVRKEGPYTLIFDLEYPNAMFPQLLTTAAAMPCNEVYFNITKGKYGLETDTTAANGPFYLKYWAHNDYLSLRRNQQFHQANAVRPTGVSFIITQQREEAVERFSKKQTDAILFRSSDYAAFQDKGYQVVESATATWGIVLNQKKKPFANLNIRKALMYCLDRDSYQSALPAYFTTARALIPPSIHLLDKQYRAYAGDSIVRGYDAKTAKTFFNKGLEQIEQKNLPNMSILVPDDLPHEQIFSYVSQIWQRELGFYLAVEKLPQKEYDAKLAAGDYDCAIISLQADYNSPEAILSKFVKDNAFNRFGYSSAEYASLLAGATQKSDLAATADVFKKTEEMLLNDAVYLPLYYQTEYFACAKTVTDLQYDPSNRMIDFMRAGKK